VRPGRDDKQGAKPAPMFFVVSKIIGFLTWPSNVLIVLALAGALLLTTRFARAGLQCLLASVLLLAICGFSPLGNALMLPLEQRFPPWNAARGAPDGIVVLGGAFETTVALARGEISLNEAAERMTSAVELARKYPNAKIVFSGGSPQIIYGGSTEAELAKRLFENLGVPASRLLAEDRSRDTDENAKFSKAIADPKPGERWLLVTSAHHMPRAIGAFRRVGFAVEAYPVDWRTRGPEDLARPFRIASDGLKRTDTAVHEWVGLVVYWTTGRSAELFPGP
jgi:uncharacterized SAM-binding protein YcdF (DUF218 family)